MRLLVSVATPAEALAAVDGGADVIDAKNPLAGALGAVSTAALRDIHAAVASRRLVTAALGDATDDTIEHVARTFASEGAALVKVGFAGISDRAKICELVASAVRGANTGIPGTAGVVVVAYADSGRAASMAPRALLDIAAREGAKGVLLDTADKSGPGLLGHVARETLAAWTAEAHEADLFVALAGKLTAADLPHVREAGADIVGVRSAACDGGRTGKVSADKVRWLRSLCAIRGGSGARLHACSYQACSADSSASRWSAATMTGDTCRGSARWK